ncbi:hypothetical protein [Desulfosporosinus meridiei]|uniref:Uncharacterized protein n=1 Tax=Desulfosporosinus meridiei (strain ATCC BAA-275 / DSM 13257 / KCTC 12902 / NCIMB 13706 / S10) TaxID=768704 RepID=J7J447_DESMD|nr:hypothetical protein [Desulfosporosinus meridiei]AFQ46043.1 hypothetical protein Desmer_4215 [Desulfosporosinus meridiei DSM 13257]
MKKLKIIERLSFYIIIASIWVKPQLDAYRSANGESFTNYWINVANFTMIAGTIILIVCLLYEIINKKHD